MTSEGHFTEDFAFSASDIRFTQSKDGRVLYAIALGWPTDGQLRIQSLRKSSGDGTNRIDRVELLGHSGRLSFQQTSEGLLVKLPAQTVSPIACTLRIAGQQLRPPG
jgi:alpha-L-fucosidase